jgi:hypothetical protein
MSRAMSNETVADLICDLKFATSERAGPRNGITRTGIPRGFRLEQSQHPLRAVRRPHRDDPPVSFGQRLRRAHARIFRVSTCKPFTLRRVVTSKPTLGRSS